MLDGLDEVAEPDVRLALVKWVESQMMTYGRNRFIITSRPYGYRDNPISGMTAVEICGFTGEQIEHFVQGWYLTNEVMSAQKDDAGVHMAALEGGNDLITRLKHTPALWTLAVNPLLLTMIATVHRYRSSLPERRVELYAEICDVFLGKRQQARGLALDLTPAQQRSVLQPLAYFMMSKRVRMLPAEQAESIIAGHLVQVGANVTPKVFLARIENSSGLLIERETGQYGFSHLTFQEYFASAHVVAAQLASDLVTHISDDWWRETLRLYCAQTDASLVLAGCLAEAGRSVPVLTLAIECNDEALRVDPTERGRLIQLLHEGIEATDPERRRLVAEALLTLRMRRLKRLDEQREADDSLITCAEYQLFIDAMYARKRCYQPDHWTSHQFAAGEGRAPVLGVRAKDAEAFCRWLAPLAAKGMQFRLPRPGELSLILGSDTCEDIGYWTELEGAYLQEGRTVAARYEQITAF